MQVSIIVIYVCIKDKMKRIWHEEMFEARKCGELEQALEVSVTLATANLCIETDRTRPHLNKMTSVKCHSY